MGIIWLITITVLVVISYSLFMHRFVTAFLTRHEQTINFFDKIGIAYLRTYLLKLLCTEFPFLATGVMSIARPTFQIIGPVMNVTTQMMETGPPGEVQLTRNTYELIFASGFRIRERGEFPLRDAATFTTYLVSPE
jgi:hypothetical protein